MDNSTAKRHEDMTVAELQTELNRLKDNLCDLEDTHAFTFGKTTVHIGAEMAQSMQEEYDQECRTYREQIAAIEALLAARDEKEM